MRWLLPLMAAATLAAESVSPVVAELLRHVEPEQRAQLGTSPPLRAAAAAVPDVRRDNARAMLLRLESGASPRTLVELTHAYIYLAQPAEAERVSRLAQSSMPGVEGFAFRAWAAQQAGDHESASDAARDGLKLSPGRPDLVAILRLSEGRAREKSSVVPALQPAPTSRPVAGDGEDGQAAREAQFQAASRLIRAATEARRIGDLDRAIVLARRAVKEDPGAKGPVEFLRQLEFATAGDAPTRNLPPLISANEAALAETIHTVARTDAGRDVAALLRGVVRIEYSKTLPTGAIAIYAPEMDTIFLPQDFASHSLLLRSNVLAHEGFHAKQDLQEQAAVSLETEIDGTTRGYAVQHELILGGIPANSGDLLVDERYRRFRASVQSGDISKFHEVVRSDYENNAAVRREEMSRQLPRWLRPIVERISFPAFHNGQSAKELEDSWTAWMWTDKKGLRSAQRMHQQELGWFSSWRKGR